MGLFDSFGKKKKSSAESSPKSSKSKPEETATRHCFVLSLKVEPPDLSHADEVVKEVFGASYSADVDEEEGIISVNHGSEGVGFLAHMPIPIPNEEAAENADRNILWPEGKEEAGRHQSHVIVTNAGATGQTPVQSAISVSKLALVALKLFDGMGVYWGNACVSNSREVFEELCDNLSEERLPVPVWLRFQLVRTADEQVGIYTLGMKQFGLMEIEAEDTPLDSEELLSFVSDIAHYLIQRGPVIKDGNTVGGSEEQRIVVRHRPSMIDKERRVYKIMFNDE